MKNSIMKPEMINDWFSLVGKDSFYITLTNFGNEDKPFFYSDNSKIVAHWIEWASIFIRPEPQSFIIKIGAGQALSNPKYFTQMQSVLSEILTIKDKLNSFKDVTFFNMFKLQLSHAWNESELKPDIIREFRNTANIYKNSGILFTLNIQIDLLWVEAKGIDYKELREFFKENMNNGIYNTVSLKNIQYAGEETKKLLNIFSGFWKFNNIMGINIIANESNHSSTKATGAELLQFYKYMKLFCPKGFMEMVMGEFMDLQRAIKDGPVLEKLDNLILKKVDKVIKSGFVINATNGLVSPIFSPDSEDFTIVDGFHHSEIEGLAFDDLNKKFRREVVLKVVNSPCAKCSAFDTCIKGKIWWLNVPRNNNGCKLGLQHHIKNG